MNRIREGKIFYLYRNSKRVPQIKIAGQYLSRFNMNVGDKIEVNVSHNSVTIKKMEVKENA